MLRFLFRSGPPDAPTVQRRVLALRAQVAHGLETPPPEVRAQLRSHHSASELAQLEDPLRMRSAAVQQELARAGVWKEMGAAERAFLSMPPLEMSAQQQADASWLLEGVACLLWALGRVDALPGWDTPADPGLLVLGVEGSAFTLRPRAELERMRSIAELWHWRARTRQMAEMGVPRGALPPGVTLDEIVAQAAGMAASDGMIPSVVDGDFPLHGKPYREAPSEAYAEAASIAMERHRALNWLCGRAPRNRWEQTPTGT